MKDFDPNKFFGINKRRPVVCYPAPMENRECELWGYYIPETKYYNVIGFERPSREMGGAEPICLGRFYSHPVESSNDGLVGYYSHKELRLGRKVLKTFGLECDLAALSVATSQADVVSVEGTDNKLSALAVGKAKLSFLSGGETLCECDVEVVDDMEVSVPEGSLKLFVGEVLYAYVEACPVFVTSDGVKAELEPVKLKMDIFSRNTGILESDVMMSKGVVIIGCGSVGSLVALELARAGVGHFLLIDQDVFGYHNICRHQCGVQDVGKFKTSALKERVLQVNPAAEVITANKRIQEVGLAVFERFCSPDCVMVGCADNREGDLYGCQHIAKPYGMPFVSIGCWERAYAGEIFYCLPSGMPDYSDFVAALGTMSGRVRANTHIYMGEVGSFEPGISADINFVTTIAVKMILDLLNLNNPAYTQRLLHNLSQYTLVCNTNDTRIGGDMAEIFDHPLQVTTSIEVPYAQKG